MKFTTKLLSSTCEKCISPLIISEITALDVSFCDQRFTLCQRGDEKKLVFIVMELLFSLLFYLFV